MGRNFHHEKFKQRKKFRTGKHHRHFNFYLPEQSVAKALQDRIAMELLKGAGAQSRTGYRYFRII
ncbi:MAG: hypothetical protein ACK5HT_16740, partial [Draconibacterium sp.]